MLADRGTCSFVTKVRDIQNTGGAAAIITNNIRNVPTVLMSDDGSGSDITIPSIFITYEDGKLLKDLISQHNRPGQDGIVNVELVWTMPHPDDHVEWTLRTSAADRDAEKFKTQFGVV